MKIPISQAKERLTKLLKTSGASDQDVNTMVDMRLEYDFHKNTFSGFEEIESIIEELKCSKDIHYEIVVNKPSVKLINGNGRSAKLVGMEVVELVSKMAKETGIGMVGIYNSTYHGILETYTRAIANHNLIGIVAANGGPQGVVPYGGNKDIFGTNPISYAIPSTDLPIVFDGATAKYAYGSIRLAKKRGQKLPENSYLNKDGKYTTDPNEATKIVPFGEHKGYAINLLLEVLTGSFVRAKMGLMQSKENELGSFFIALDPSTFTPIEQFKQEVSQIIKEILAVSPAEGFKNVSVPGLRGEEAKQKMIQEGYIEIDDLEWKSFEKLYNEKLKG